MVTNSAILIVDVLHRKKPDGTYPSLRSFVALRMTMGYTGKKPDGTYPSLRSFVALRMTMGYTEKKPDGTYPSGFHPSTYHPNTNGHRAFSDLLLCSSI